MNRQSGLTLIEIMVVVLIIGVLATMIVPNVLDQKNTALKVKAQSDIRALTQALKLYNLHNNKFPSTDEGLQALAGEDGKGGLDEIPTDPWGNEYNYLYPGQNSTFDIWSNGADGQQGGDGDGADIGNWNLNKQ